jgi:magnesium-protoporphyrin O-methyltransferase
MSSNCCGAEKVFDAKTAKKELRKYVKSGPGKATKRLLSLIGTSQLKDKSLLDIGGGIGAIQWHFLTHGGGHTSDVDYSPAYLETAKSFAIEKGWQEKVAFIEGDFLDKSDQLEPHDFVTLDKVVCCYPDYSGLLEKALNKTENSIGLVYPRDGLIAEIVAFFGRVFLKLSGNDFRPYIHKVSDIRGFIESKGFQRERYASSFPWHVELYRKIL